MMPWPYEASVINRAGSDYWRTWFFEECESAGLFGINEKHLPLIKASGPGFSAYRVGTEIFLEDAPYFKASKTHHRVCGPYHVVTAKVTAESKTVYVVDEAVIIYQEAHPENGPWLDRSRVTRIIEGIKVSFPHIAKEYGYYPYRFAIKRSKKFKIEHIPHEEGNCWLCVHAHGGSYRRR
jgi:hypothetical protein